MHFCTKKIVLAASDTRYLIDQHIAVWDLGIHVYIFDLTMMLAICLLCDLVVGSITTRSEVLLWSQPLRLDKGVIYLFQLFPRLFWLV